MIYQSCFFQHWRKALMHWCQTLLSVNEKKHYYYSATYGATRAWAASKTSVSGCGCDAKSTTLVSVSRALTKIVSTSGGSRENSA